MATSTLTTSGAIGSTVTFVTTAVPNLTCNLATGFATGDAVRFVTTSVGTLKVLDQLNRRVILLAPGTSCVATKLASGLWSVNTLPMAPQTHIADSATTGATNSTPYGFTTAAQPDAIVTKLNLILAALRKAGILKAE